MPTLPLDQAIARRARWAAIGAVALLPLSYVWLVAPRGAAGWVFPLTATAEIGAIVLGFVAVAYGIRARRLMPHGRGVRWPSSLSLVGEGVCIRVAGANTEMWRQIAVGRSLDRYLRRASRCAGLFNPVQGGERAAVEAARASV